MARVSLPHFLPHLTILKSGFLGVRHDMLGMDAGMVGNRLGPEEAYRFARACDRKTGTDGKLPAVGDTVDAKDASYTNTIGAPLLTGYWKDPDFDPCSRSISSSSMRRSR